MGVMTQYSMMPFVPKSQKFRTGDGENIFTEDDAIKIYVEMKKRNQTAITKEKAKAIETSLNKAIKDNTHHYEKMIKKTADRLNSELYSELSKIGVLEQTGGTFTIDREKVAEYEKEVRDICSRLFKNYQTSDELKDVNSRLNGSLNNLRGDIFENFIAAVFDMSREAISEVAEETAEKLVNSFTESIRGFGGRRTVIRKGNQSYKSKTASVTGGDNKKTIEVLIDGERMAITGGSVKSDVVIKGLDNPIGISAKNYSTNSSLSLLSGGSVIGLIENWEDATEEVKNLAINGLSARDISAGQFNIMKKLFLIQGAMGTAGEDYRSQLIVINRNTDEDPIKIISLYSLLFDYDKFEGVYETKNFLTDVPRPRAKFLNFVQSATISIKTQLTLNQIYKI